MHKILPTFWTTLLNKCFLLWYFPKVWKKASVIAIPKTDKSKLQTVKGYRGISLLSIPGKCLENWWSGGSTISWSPPDKFHHNNTHLQLAGPQRMQQNSYRVRSPRLQTRNKVLPISTRHCRCLR
jgi:hypothetical protein